MRALVVDDHGLTRRYLREILVEACGFDEVEEAADGEEALALIAAAGFDLVVLDINMPRRDGLSVLAETGASRPACAFIVLSGLPEQDYAEKALRLGAAAYLVKGCPPEEIAATVRKALSQPRSSSPS
jgi:two-component system, NarL family, invasion response regulator UvrY